MEVRLLQLHVPRSNTHNKHTQIYLCTKHVYMYIYMVHGQPHRSRQTESIALMKTQHQRPHLASLSGWSGWRSIAGEYIYTYALCGCLQQLGSDTATGCPEAAPGSQSTQLLALRHMRPWGHSQLQLLVHIITQIHTWVSQLTPKHHSVPHRWPEQPGVSCSQILQFSHSHTPIHRHSWLPDHFTYLLTSLFSYSLWSQPELQMLIPSFTSTTDPWVPATCDLTLLVM